MTLELSTTTLRTILGQKAADAHSRVHPDRDCTIYVVIAQEPEAPLHLQPEDETYWFLGDDLLPTIPPRIRTLHNFEDAVFYAATMRAYGMNVNLLEARG